jgi:periplasmic divalent cation tolerance protein
MELRLVYITAADLDEAKRLASALVAERLAACANILPGMQSCYWWEGAVQHEQEVVLIAKTRAARLDALIARVRALHSYSCPCVVALPITEGDPDYLAWIAAETADATA